MLSQDGKQRSYSAGNLYVPKLILIADDSSTVRRILKMFLQDRKDIKVCAEAANGFEAVEKAKLLRPDLVLLDLAMPKMNGAEAASVLKKALPNERIIVFTMFGENIGRAMTNALGVDLVLSKPDGMRALVEALDKLLCPEGPAASANHPSP
jgi:DNA-binding NarL/FixJ family response regulator